MLGKKKRKNKERARIVHRRRTTEKKYNRVDVRHGILIYHLLLFIRFSFHLTRELKAPSDVILLNNI